MDVVARRGKGFPPLLGEGGVRGGNPLVRGKKFTYNMLMSKNQIIFVVVIIILIVSAFILKKNQAVKQEPFLLKVESKLSPDNKAFVEKRLAENQQKLAEFNKETSIIDKINLYFVISVDQRALGEYGEAKKTLEIAMSIDPKNSNLMQTYSSLLAVMGDKKGALDYINKAILLYPLEDNYWRWKVELEKDMGKTSSELENIYKEALVQTKNDLNIVTYYAAFLEGEKKYDEAIAQWQEAMKIEPSLKANYQAEIDRLKAM